jgi:ankyrin repeat protein
MSHLELLWDCAEVDDLARFKALVQSTPDINFVEDGETLLGYFSRLIPDGCDRYLKFVDYLLTEGADPNVSDSLGRSPMSNFARADHVEYIKLLERHGADLAYRAKQGNSALQEALRVNCSKRVAEYILRHPNTVLDEDTKEELLKVARRASARESLALLRTFGIEY